MTPHAPQRSTHGDLMIYFVLCRYKSGLAWAERDPANMSLKDTLADIRSGELPNVVTVLECNPVEHVCSDVTDDVLAECLKANFIQLGEKLFAEQINHARDHRKQERV